MSDSKPTLRIPAVLSAIYAANAMADGGDDDGEIVGAALEAGAEKVLEGLDATTSEYIEQNATCVGNNSYDRAIRAIALMAGGDGDKADFGLAGLEVVYAADEVAAKAGPVNVGVIRAAIAGLADTDPIQPVWANGPPGDHDPAVEICGFAAKVDADGAYLSILVDIRYLNDGAPTDIEECDECKSRIPYESGSVENRHHSESCSLYDPDKD